MTAAKTHNPVVEALLARYGQTFCNELGIDIDKNTPSPLFMLLCAALLYSARIRADAATKALKALFDSGWRTPRKMAESTWQNRVEVLNAHGYARFDESTARMLGETTGMLLRSYDGDLRKLREAAERKPPRERRLLKVFNGIGDVGVNIFFREAQLAWPELYPFADKPALTAAKRLDLGDTPDVLARLVAREEFARLVAALVRVHLARAHEEVLAAANA